MWHDSRDLRRLCRFLARRIVSDLRRAGYAPELGDALAGARFGAWRATETFDPSKGTKLTTWAYPWIKRYATLEAYASAGLNSKGDGPHFYGWNEPTGDKPDGRSEPYITEDDPAEAWTDNVALRQAVSRLPETERVVLYLWYWADLDQRAVAARMSLSRARIRFLHDRAIEHLRESIT
jgi:RNA polymerase sigma factor (sigma-70 family)